MSEADIAVALVSPSLLMLVRRFSRLRERSTRLSLSLELERPLSVLSALLSAPLLLAAALLDLGPGEAEGSFGLAADMLGRGGTELGAA